ncbi:MAG: Trk system potassium transporter TrkA [Planctomycetes bacterium]|nr:Trk system potassium transporter TrkA [Planctomycetota bacterium]
MNILIVGAGAVGFNLAKQLSSEGHDVSLVEKDPHIARKISEKLDVLLVTGSGSTPGALEAARIKEAEIVLAVTDSDEVNLAACLLAHWYGVDRKIARLRNEEYTREGSFFREKQFFIDHIINPDFITVDSILKVIETPGANYVADFAEASILFRGFHVPPDAPIVGRKLQELKEFGSTDSFLIVAVQRKDEMLIPTGQTQIEPEDTIFVLVARASLPFFLPIVNRRAMETQRVIIYGATRVGTQLAQLLEKQVKMVVLVEPDEDKAQLAASRLTEATVLHGHATETEILKEVTSEAVDFFVGAAEDEEANILSCLLAKKQYARKTIVITKEPDYVPIFGSIGMDVVINPRLFTVSSILQHIIRGPILSMVKLFDRSEAEAIEMVVEKESKMADKALRHVHFPKGSILGAIIRKGEMILPHGDFVVASGDRAIVFTTPQGREKIQSLFTKG